MADEGSLANVGSSRCSSVWDASAVGSVSILDDVTGAGLSTVSISSLFCSSTSSSLEGTTSVDDVGAPSVVDDVVETDGVVGTADGVETDDETVVVGGTCAWTVVLDRLSDVKAISSSGGGTWVSTGAATMGGPSRGVPGTGLSKRDVSTGDVPAEVEDTITPIEVEDKIASSISVTDVATGVVADDAIEIPSSIMVELLGNAGGAIASPGLEEEDMFLFRPGRLLFKAQIQLALCREAW